MWMEFSSNLVLISSILGWLTAQLLKTLINMLLNRKFNPERLVGSGGMPSSHSATVCALSASSLMVYGISSFEFAVSVIFAFIVMYDAMGVRRETGEQAKLLNQILTSFRNHEEFPFSEKKLKEYIGHTPVQVFAGAILGIVIAVIVC